MDVLKFVFFFKLNPNLKPVNFKIELVIPRPLPKMAHLTVITILEKDDLFIQAQIIQ